MGGGANPLLSSNSGPGGSSFLPPLTTALAMSNIEPYEAFEFVPNSLQFYYPKQVQRQLQKKKFQNSERLLLGLKAPTGSKEGVQKNLAKMRALTDCQMQFIRVVFQKIDRKSKPIKKQEKIVTENLKRKRIFLEEENFDILSVLHSSSQSQALKPSSSCLDFPHKSSLLNTSHSLLSLNPTF